MKKLLSLILCLVLVTSVLVACTPDGCAHQYVDGVCQLCSETDVKYQASTDGQTATRCAHVYVDGVCTKCQDADANYVAPVAPVENGELTIAGNGKYLLVDPNGNYGGTRNRGQYGIGAPLNGMYDQPNTQYYTINDYYNMKSTKRADGTAERTIYTGFAPYQQTTRYSGIANSVAVLNYWGETVTTETELELIAKYEEANSTTLSSRESDTGLANMWKALGYNATVETFVSPGGTRQELVGAFRTWIEPRMAEGKMVFVHSQDNMDNRWRLIIGFDNVGTDDYATDDVIIFADANDNFDHYQDGYAISGAGRFERWWYDMTQLGTVSNKYKAVVVDPKQPVTIERVLKDMDTTELVQTKPENHIIRNRESNTSNSTTPGKDWLEAGSYGGSYNTSKYGSATPYNGFRDQYHNYHKFVDAYNLQSIENQRWALTGYRGFSQTHKSSCGLCAMFSMTMYYGFDRDIFNETAMVVKYESVNGVKVYNKGTSSTGNANMLMSLGAVNVEGRSYSTSEGMDAVIFKTFEDFAVFAVDNLGKKQPIAVSWFPHGGHWETIMCYDNMGTPDYIYDDIVVLADSGDSWDHYQDGFNVYPATLFYRQWMNSKKTSGQAYVVINRAGNEALMIADNNQA